MRRITTCLATALALLALAPACSSPGATHFDELWTAPALESTHFQKLLALAPFPNGTDRRRAEDQLAAHLSGFGAVAAYTVLSDAELADLAKAKEKVVAAGFDGAVVLKSLGEKQEQRTEVSARPSLSLGFWGGDVGVGAGVSMSPTTRVEMVHGVETMVYSLPSGELLLSANTRTDATSDPVALVDAVVDSLRRELKNRRYAR